MCTLQEHKAYDRKEVHEDDGKDEGEDNGPDVPCHRPDHILESLLMSYEVNELKKVREFDFLLWDRQQISTFKK